MFNKMFKMEILVSKISLFSCLLPLAIIGGKYQVPCIGLRFHVCFGV